MKGDTGKVSGAGDGHRSHVGDCREGTHDKEGGINTDATICNAVSLPPELWARIVAVSDRRTVAALAATCAALKDLSSQRARANSEAARVSLDAVVDRWERHTGHWDDVWSHSDSRGRCYACTPMGARTAQHRVRDRRDSRRSRSQRRWISDCGTPDDPTATDLCDTCAIAIARDMGTWPMRRVDLDAPHVWSVGRTISDVLDVLPSGPIADDRFVVPAAATYMVDRTVASQVAQWTLGEIEVGFAGFRPSHMPSVRAWLPLAVVNNASHARMLCVCCDADSPLWGTVAVVQWWPRASFLGWSRVADSIEQAAAGSCTFAARALGCDARGRYRGVPRDGEGVICLAEALLADNTNRTWALCQRPWRR
jgi:hypothetical protein